MRLSSFLLVTMISTQNRLVTERPLRLPRYSCVVQSRRMTVANWPAILCTALASSLSVGALADSPPPDSPQARQEAERLNQLPPAKPTGGVRVDHSGRK